MLHIPVRRALFFPDGAPLRQISNHPDTGALRGTAAPRCHRDRELLMSQWGHPAKKKTKKQPTWDRQLRRRRQASFCTAEQTSAYEKEKPRFNNACVQMRELDVPALHSAYARTDSAACVFREKSAFHVFLFLSRQDWCICEKTYTLAAVGFNMVGRYSSGWM